MIDSADVLIQVLDVRDPMGTRSKRIEAELRKPDRRHKHMVLVLNKCDLVPTWVTVSSISRPPSSLCSAAMGQGLVC